jgi:hypothetical protein
LEAVNQYGQISAPRSGLLSTQKIKKVFLYPR